MGFFVESWVTILDHVWLVRLCFENSRTAQMIVWIHFSCYVQNPFLLRLFHNIGITSYSWPGQIYNENDLCFFIEMLKLPVQSKEVPENKQTKEGINFKCTARLQLWVCCLCIALLNVKSMIPAQMGVWPREEPRQGYSAFCLLHRFYCMFALSLLFSLV